MEGKRRERKEERKERRKGGRVGEENLFSIYAAWHMLVQKMGRKRDQVDITQNWCFPCGKRCKIQEDRTQKWGKRRKWLERESSISPLWTSEISVITCRSTCIISFGLTRVSGQIWGFLFRSRGDLDTTRLHVLPEDSSCPWTGISANYSEGEFDLSLYQPSGWKWHKNFPCLTPMHLLISKCRKRQIVLITRPWAGYINHPSQQRLLTQCGLLKLRNSQTTYNNVYLVT